MYNVTAGTEYQYNDVIDEMRGYNRLVDQEVGTVGTYAQLKVKPLDYLTLLLGARYDHIDIDGRYKLGEKTSMIKSHLMCSFRDFRLCMTLAKS